MLAGGFGCCRGRAEVVKLICSAKDIPLENVDVDFQNMKTDRTAYPFGQCECGQAQPLSSTSLLGLT